MVKSCLWSNNFHLEAWNYCGLERTHFDRHLCFGAASNMNPTFPKKKGFMFSTFSDFFGPFGKINDINGPNLVPWSLVLLIVNWMMTFQHPK